MNQKKLIIVDDEKLAQDLIINYLSNNSDISIIGTYNNGLDALKAIQTLQPDIVLLDIQMPKITGIELAELIDIPVQIIFTTAYDEYAIKAFELSAIDYLLKPFSKERLQEALNKAIEKSETVDVKKVRRLISQNRIKNNRIAVKKQDKILLIPFNDILYVKAQDDYVEIITNDASYLKKQTLDSLLNDLPENFIHIHRSNIINLNFLKHIEKEGKENYFAIMKNGSPLKISRNKYRLLKEKIGIK